MLYIFFKQNENLKKGSRLTKNKYQGKNCTKGRFYSRLPQWGREARTCSELNFTKIKDEGVFKSWEDHRLSLFAN